MGLGLVGWAALYVGVYGVAWLLLDGLTIAYEPNDNVCVSLTDQTEERIRAPLIVATAVATIWAAAGGLLVTYAGAQAIGDRALRRTWTATVAVVVGLLTLWVIPAIGYHQVFGAGVVLMLIAVPGGGALLVGAIVGICVWATRVRHSPIRAPALGPIPWLISLAVFILGVVFGIAGLYAGPLDPIAEVPVC